MSYTAKSLEEIAALFEERALERFRLCGGSSAPSAYFGAGQAWHEAAEILRRTTLTEPCHMEATHVPQ